MTICGVGISVMMTKSCNDAVRVMTICGVGISIMMIKLCNDDMWCWYFYNDDKIM